MSDFNLLIIKWYRQNKRNLPWRITKDPYKIWLSEVILQQTKVNQGINYYVKFITNYPTITDLANASEQEVLSDWQGLGYYSRARNLHQSAKIIRDEYKGLFPINYIEILKLKGVGSYTAAAIASFSFDLAHAVVDGNVYRVLSRIYDIEIPIDTNQGQKEFLQLANSLLNPEHPAEHNQAIMEFGALQCTPTNPKCETCPFVQSCMARKNNTIQLRPVKKGKTKVRNRYFHFLHIEDETHILLQKRLEKDIWQNMYQFPLIEKDTIEDMIQLKKEIVDRFGKRVELSKSGVKHILSHQHLHTTFWRMKELPKVLKENSEYVWVEKKELGRFPIPRVIERYLEGMNDE